MCYIYSKLPSDIHYMIRIKLETERNEPYVDKLKFEFCMAFSGDRHSTDEIDTKLSWLPQVMTDLLRILSFKHGLWKTKLIEQIDLKVWHASTYKSSDFL